MKWIKRFFVSCMVEALEKYGPFSPKLQIDIYQENHSGSATPITAVVSRCTIIGGIELNTKHKKLADKKNHDLGAFEPQPGG